jgi:mono/diheme cytochrome c family protein
MRPENRGTGITVVMGSVFLVGTFLVVGFSGVLERISMSEQPSIHPYEPSPVFENRQSARPLPEGAVARSHGPDELTAAEPADYASGRTRGEAPEGDVDGPGDYPVPVTEELVETGQEQYEIYCSPCHGSAGYGDGVVVQRGMVSPPSYHIPRLRQQSPKYFYDTITNGFGRMYSYASRVPPRERWAIVAYIEALQLSQNAPASQLESQDRRRLEGEGP